MFWEARRDEWRHSIRAQSSCQRRLMDGARQASQFMNNRAAALASGGGGGAHVNEGGGSPVTSEHVGPRRLVCLPTRFIHHGHSRSVVLCCREHLGGRGGGVTLFVAATAISIWGSEVRVWAGGLESGLLFDFVVSDVNPTLVHLTRTCLGLRKIFLSTRSCLSS